MDEESIRDEIVVLMRSGDGFVDNDHRLSLADLRNTVPIIGDRLSLHLEEEGLAVYRVLDRYLVDLRFSSDGGNDALFWVLVVDQFDEDHSHEFDQLVRAIYREEFATSWRREAIPSAPVQTAETLDRTNRDPAYWTFERKEILRKEREARLAAIRDGISDKD